MHYVNLVRMMNLMVSNMSRLDEKRSLVPVNIAIMTVSDTRTFKTDTSGQVLVDCLTTAGHTLAGRAVVSDDIEGIVTQLRSWIVNPWIDVVITTGGTGITGRDVVPEAFCRVIEKEIEGFGELFRWLSYAKIGTSTIQSRAIGGVASGTYLFAIPGSTSACQDAWDGILVWQLDSRHQPCNLVELMPRLQEHLKSC